METKVFTRKELYDLVWSESILSLSKTYNISDVGLRKICVKAAIPIPQNGHWQKVKFGKKIIKPALSSDYYGADHITLKIRSDLEKKIPGVLSPLFIIQKQLENNLQDKLVVPDKLKNPDVLVVKTKDYLINQKADRFRYIGTVHSSRNELDIRVTKANIPRALRFFDTLIKILHTRGHNVTLRSSGTYAIIGGDEFRIFLREKAKAVTVKETNWNNTVYHPTGILSFHLAYFSKEWKDGKSLLESQLSKILAHLELIANERKERRILAEVKEEERKKKEKIQQDYRILKAKELTDFKDTLEKANRWHKANNLRNYIDALESNAKEKNNITEELIHWLQWARQKADWYDPFIENNDELLDNINRNTLTIDQTTLNYN